MNAFDAFDIMGCVSYLRNLESRISEADPDYPVFEIARGWSNVLEAIVRAGRPPASPTLATHPAGPGLPSDPHRPLRQNTLTPRLVEELREGVQREEARRASGIHRQLGNGVRRRRGY